MPFRRHNFCRNTIRNSTDFILISLSMERFSVVVQSILPCHKAYKLSAKVFHLTNWKIILCDYEKKTAKFWSLWCVDWRKMVMMLLLMLYHQWCSEISALPHPSSGFVIRLHVWRERICAHAPRIWTTEDKSVCLRGYKSPKKMEYHDNINISINMRTIREKRKKWQREKSTETKWKMTMKRNDDCD